MIEFKGWLIHVDSAIKYKQLATFLAVNSLTGFQRNQLSVFIDILCVSSEKYYNPINELEVFKDNIRKEIERLQRNSENDSQEKFC